jgi:predicted acyl esterase
MALDLWAAFDTYDSNIYAALVDVAPDGTQRQITTGGLMASHRALDPRRSLKTPAGDIYLPYHPFTQAAQTDLVRAEPTRLQVEMYPTDWQVPAGHRVRLLIGTSDTPHYAPPADRLAKMLGGTVRILTGPQYPSRLVLPVQAPVR